MRGNIYLSGGGHAKDSYVLDSLFVNSLKNRRLLYIPIGLERTIIGYEECFEWITNTLAVHSKKHMDISMWLNIKDVELEDLETFDAIYIGGAKGAEKLMFDINKAGFDENLQGYSMKGGIVYGGSAGALILGNKILPYGDNINQDTKLISGLGLVGKYSLYCHYDEGQDKFIADFQKLYNLPVLAIPEGCGVIIEDKSVKVVGNIGCTFFKGKSIKYIRPNLSFSIENNENF